MYISGTHKNIHNIESDYATWPKIAMDNIKDTPRYKQAEQILRLHPEVDVIVGHSLGSKIAQELIKDKQDIKYGRLYGAPIITGYKDNRIKYFSHYFDPVGILTNKPKRNIYFGDPHSYKGFKEYRNN